MRWLIAVSFATVALSASAQACDQDYMYETSFVEHQVAAGVSEAQAKEMQEAALALREENMLAARRAFMDRFGGALGAAPTLTQASVTSTEKVVSDADRRTDTYAQNR